MACLYVGLGSNLGDKEKNLGDAIFAIERQIGLLKARSVFFASSPWGYESANTYLNAVVAVETPFNPLECLRMLKGIEKAMGRPEKRPEAYQDRIIDLDILFYDDWILEEEGLLIPHPLLHLRNFVLVPLAEIAPDRIHPVLKKTIAELLAKLNGRS